MLRQSLQIPQFTNWQAKQTEEVLVQDYFKLASILRSKVLGKRIKQSETYRDC